LTVKLFRYEKDVVLVWVRFFRSHCPGRVAGWAISRSDFRMFDFRYVGSIGFIPLDLFQFPISFFWVRFFILIARIAWPAERPRDSIFLRSFFASLALSNSFHSTYLTFRFLFAGFAFF